MPVDFAVTLERVRRGDKGVLIDIENRMEGLVGLDPQEQLIAILQTLSKEELERIPDGAGMLKYNIESALRWVSHMDPMRPRRPQCNLRIGDRTKSPIVPPSGAVQGLCM